MEHWTLHQKELKWEQKKTEEAAEKGSWLNIRKAT
jgi:hypothetical protein